MSNPCGCWQLPWISYFHIDRPSFILSYMSSFKQAAWNVFGQHVSDWRCSISPYPSLTKARIFSTRPIGIQPHWSHEILHMPHQIPAAAKGGAKFKSDQGHQMIAFQKHCEYMWTVNSEYPVFPQICNHLNSSPRKCQSKGHEDGKVMKHLLGILWVSCSCFCCCCRCHRPSKPTCLCDTSRYVKRTIETTKQPLNVFTPDAITTAYLIWPNRRHAQSIAWRTCSGLMPTWRLVWV